MTNREKIGEELMAMPAEAFEYFLGSLYDSMELGDEICRRCKERNGGVAPVDCENEECVGHDAVIGWLDDECRLETIIQPSKIEEALAHG